MTSDESMTAEQKKCDEDTGHDWRRVPYESDVNYGGFMQCKLCGWIQSDDGYDYGFED